MTENENLGERTIFFKEQRIAMATTKNDVEVYYLEKEDFWTALQKHLKGLLKDNTVN